MHRILVVDDNPAIHRDFEKILAGSRRHEELSSLERDLFGAGEAPPSATQFALTCVLNGQDALVALRRALQEGRPFSMAFVDMRMPGWNGIETVTQLFRVQGSLQVAICSAYMDYSWHEVLQKLQRPGLRLLRKPWTSGEVLALVHELCGRAAQAKQPASRR